MYPCNGVTLVDPAFSVAVCFTRKADETDAACAVRECAEEYEEMLREVGAATVDGVIAVHKRVRAMRVLERAADPLIVRLDRDVVDAAVLRLLALRGGPTE